MRLTVGTMIIGVNIGFGTAIANSGAVDVHRNPDMVAQTLVNQGIVIPEYATCLQQLNHDEFEEECVKSLALINSFSAKLGRGVIANSERQILKTILEEVSHRQRK